jgi:hypothetical protein
MPVQPKLGSLKNSQQWDGILNEDNWQRVFLTYKAAWKTQRGKVRKALEKSSTEILDRAKRNALSVDFTGACALPGPLDPVGFKGLKGLTGGSYSEGQTKVDELNWALGCLGGAIGQRYKIQKALGNKWEYLVSLPAPEEVRFTNFLKIRESVYGKGLKYTSARNAAAHFSVLLADRVRYYAANQDSPVRFSAVMYFSLFQSGQQFKPSTGGLVSLSGLTNIALDHPDEAFEMFKAWDYLFRRGSAQGNEDLAEAITELVMAPSLETYYRHARIFNRYIVDTNKGVKQENLYTQGALKEVMRYAGS